MVGASHIGGKLADRGDHRSFLLMLASLNFFLGMFNYYRLGPVVLVAVVLFAAFTLLSITADLVNPVQLTD